MKGIENKAIVLKLNRLWQPVGYGIVAKALVDLYADVATAINLDYSLDDDGNPDFDNPTSMQAVNWEEWIKLPIRSWDFSISTPNMEIRVPTILVSSVFDEMPIRTFNGKPSPGGVFMRDRGIDQYSGKRLSEDDASIDHVIPRSKGGSHTWDNVVLTHKKLNYLKGNRMNHELGLKLIRSPKAPAPIPISALITKVRHPDWKPFLIHKG